MKRSYKIILLIFAAVLILLVIGKKAGWFGGSEGTKVSVEAASLQSITETVSASGKIQPEVEVKLSPEVSGEITMLEVKEGDLVNEGDLLVKINPAVYEAATQRLQAALSQARSNLDVAKAQQIETNLRFKRNKELFEKGAISTQEWEASQSENKVAALNVSSAQFAVNSAKASLLEAQQNQARTTIFAPISGVVSALNVELGERVLGTAQMQGTELMRISDFSAMEVVVDVNENDIVRVTQGDTALVEVDAFLGREFKGLVTEIASSADLVGTSADQVTNFEVKIRILPSSYKDLVSGGKNSPFRPGMTAAVEIRTEVQPHAVAVPIQAVTIRTDTSEKALRYSMMDGENPMEVVFVLDGSKVRPKVVKTGIQDDEYIQVVSGLKEGEEVVTGPYSALSKQLRNGDRVDVVDEDKLFDKE